MISRRTKQGFTIVELLIVIVVIGILAAVTIVAYNGVQNRAKVAAAQSGVSQASKKIMAFAVQNSDAYPITLAEAGVQNSGDTNYQYTVNNNSTPRTYCVTATVNTTNYWISNASTSPSSGSCPGHGVGGIPPITNLVLNPTLETNNLGYNNANSAVFSRVANTMLGGTYLGQVVLASGGVVPSGVGIYTAGNLSGTAANSTYTLSVDVYSDTARTIVLSVQGSGVVGGTNTSPDVIFTAGQIRRVSITFTTSDWSSGSAVLAYLIRTSTTPGTLYFRNLSMYAGNVSYGYADGNSPGWAWTGTPHASTSTGPPL